MMILIEMMMIKVIKFLRGGVCAIYLIMMMLMIKAIRYDLDG